MLSSGERNIEEAIWLILRTTIGERAGLEPFGSTLEEMAYDPLNATLLVMLCVAVEEALQAWEPRIEVEDVRAEPDPIRGRVDLTIEYQVVEDYEPRSMVYPFYLQAAATEEDERRLVDPDEYS